MRAFHRFLFSPLSTLALVATLVALALIRVWQLLITMLILVLLISMPAVAAVATTAQPDTLLHISPDAWTEINELLIGLLLAVGGIVLKWIEAHSPLKQAQAQEVTRQAFQNILDTGAKYGLSQLKAAETKVGDIDVGNAAVAAGANFVIAHAPEMAAKLGVDVTTPEGQAAIIRSLTARISDKLAVPADAAASIPLPAAVAAPANP